MEQTIWAFDLGKGSIGEAVRQKLDFPHKESLLIPPDLARRGPSTVSGTPACRYRAMKTREAHHERERWLETVWKAMGLAPLDAREVWENPATGKWELKRKADYRLEREFAPKIGEKTKDGAPSDAAGANVCYTSCLLRIRLLQGDKSLAEWQVYKALRAALQHRGYGRVPWAAKEARKQGRTPEELQQEEEKQLQQADPCYRDAVGRWPEFKRSVSIEFHLPCYYDALKMGLWNPSDPHRLLERASHLTGSTRNVRLDRVDVRAELVRLGDKAAGILSPLRDAFARWQQDGWKNRHPVTGAGLTYPVVAKTFGEFLCDGPAGKPDETSFEAFLSQRREADVRRGSFEEWMGALGQKTPSFDNRILNDCVLIPRYHVCRVDVRLETSKDGKPTGKFAPESLLATEVTFLLKLKNLLVAAVPFGQRKLTVEEIRAIFDYAHCQLKALKLVNAEGELTKNWPGKVADCFSLSQSEWGKDKALGKLRVRPMPGHEEVQAPKPSGRSGYSRVALRILKELILSGEAPSAFHARLLRRDLELLRRLGSSPQKTLALFDDSIAADEQQRKREDTDNRKSGLLASELHFLLQMRKDLAGSDSWENIFIPSQTLDALQLRHTNAGKLNADAAIRDLLGTVNDPIVRHRLQVFAKRLKKLQHGDKRENLPGFGVPDVIVLEFVREDFMGEQAKRDYQKFINDREKERRAAREEAEKLGLESRSSGLRYELFKAQGGICLYTGKPLSETRLDEYEIDHIVPRSLGGPDAAVNYVLTFHDINSTKEKGKLTPFALLRGKEGWDAYVKRVGSRASTLRNKKVQLLTREDAPELVERYTALAETAWVSKLAQTILNLHFGWTNGYDDQRQKRVIVVSGGLTARVRRKYGLDKLLYSDVTDPEILARRIKNREDKRHHALDAMVLTFIPQWARDPNKEGFFRFPAEFRDSTGRENYQSVRELFQKHIAQVMPRQIAYERPALADTSFGLRCDAGKPVIVKRISVFDLAQEPAGAPGKTKFSLRYLTKKIESIRDDTIRRRLKVDFLGGGPNETSWKKYCDSFAQIRKGGTLGARIIKVWVNVGEPNEFKDLSKDSSGAWRKAKDDHQGQIIYTDADGNLAVKPVYAHASIKHEKQRIAGIGGKSKVHCFVRSKCLIRLRKELPQADYKLVIRNEQKQKRRVPAKTPLQPATFMLNTIITGSMDVEFTAANGQRLVAALPALVDVGFEPL